MRRLRLMHATLTARPLPLPRAPARTSPRGAPCPASRTVSVPYYARTQAKPLGCHIIMQNSSRPGLITVCQPCVVCLPCALHSPAAPFLSAYLSTTDDATKLRAHRSSRPTTAATEPA